MKPLSGTTPNAWIIRRMKKVEFDFEVRVSLPFDVGIKFKRLADRVVVGPTTCTLIKRIRL